MVMIIMQSVAKLTQAVFAQSISAQYNMCKISLCTRLEAVAAFSHGTQALGKGMDADHDREESLRRARRQGAVSAFSGEPHAGILVGFEAGINIANELRRRRISQAEASGCNARELSASMRR